MLADLVVVVHFAFIILIAAGGLLAWRWPWPWLIWIHVPAVAWGIGIVTVGWDCPLTGLEHELRDRAGESVNDGFIDRYVEGPLSRAVHGRPAGTRDAAVVIGWVGFVVRRHDRARARSAMIDASPNRTPTSAC